jgi:hypothetical protein
MRRTRFVAMVVLLAAAGSFASCGYRPWVLVLALSGTERVSDQLWVEHGMPVTARAALLQAIAVARSRLARTFGTVCSSPRVVACCTEGKARSLGLRGRALALTVRGPAILLGPGGLAVEEVLHEWTHAELDARLPRAVVHRLPRWFDEGLARVVSDDPHYSEGNWRRIESRGTETPHLNELCTFQQWDEAMRRYRRERSDTTSVRGVVGTVAAHEVRGWLARAGRDGLPRLIAALNAGEAFGPAYLRIGGSAPEGP